MTTESTTTTAIVAERIRVTYASAVALSDVSLHATAGSITAIVGPNGAGKSSLIHALYGSQTATGKITIAGQDVTSLSAAQRARLGVGLVPQGRQLFPLMSVRENLRVMADLLELGSEPVEKALDRFPILRTRADSLAGWLSGGEQQMLAVSRALLVDPQILLLDEVATGLAPIIVDHIAASIQELADAGTTIILAAPELGALEAIVDRGYVLLRGVRVADSEDGGKGVQDVYRNAMRGNLEAEGKEIHG